MPRLNREAAAAGRALPAGSVSACTDVTGFGLAGHACEMAEASGVVLEIDGTALPVLPGAAALAAGNLPGGARTNREHFGARVELGPGVADPLPLLVFDPQTSGGLLMAVSPGASAVLLATLRQGGVDAHQIGRVSPGRAGAPIVQIR